MKKALVVLLVIFIIAIIVYLDINGIITWQPLSIIIAALAAPFRFVMGLFGDPEKKIRERHALIRQQESEFQQTLESEITAREQNVSSLERDVDLIDEEIETLDSQLEALQKKRKLLRSRSKKMSIEERRKQGRELFGS